MQVKFPFGLKPHLSVACRGTEPFTLPALSWERHRDQDEEGTRMHSGSPGDLGKEHRLLNLLPAGSATWAASYRSYQQTQAKPLAFQGFCWGTPTRPISRDQFLTFWPLSLGAAFPRPALNWDFGKLELPCSPGWGQVATQWVWQWFQLLKPELIISTGF